MTCLCPVMSSGLALPRRYSFTTVRSKAILVQDPYWFKIKALATVRCNSMCYCCQTYFHQDAYLNLAFVRNAKIYILALTEALTVLPLRNVNVLPVAPQLFHLRCE